MLIQQNMCINSGIIWITGFTKNSIFNCQKLQQSQNQQQLYVFKIDSYWLNNQQLVVYNQNIKQQKIFLKKIQNSKLFLQSDLADLFIIKFELDCLLKTQQPDISLDSTLDKFFEF
eukprot:TRINITY_DN13646_c0_g1_i1.p3 TRINITY_DN13646_c0_g1~~TRINITY_DN13646_c0_g1_i1.p3  ORF type:complete len:116 (-),score=0.04 TRINITY_DN13646_c0_g1_i1:157-504(-)